MAVDSESAPAMLDTSRGVATDNGGPMRPDDSTRRFGARPILKVCSKCGDALPATRAFFGPDARQRYGLTSQCKKCRSEASLRCYRLKRDHYLEGMRQYRVSNLERERARQRAWVEKNRDKHCEKSRRYYRAHRSAVNAATANRRARVACADGTHSQADTTSQANRQRWKCYWCGKQVRDAYHVDHVVPIALGGSNAPENLVITCRFCNLSKGAKHPMDWAGTLF